MASSVLAEAEFVQHVACPVCREKGLDIQGDNLALYDDGHGYCFACRTYFPEGLEGDRKGQPTVKGLVLDGKYRSLNKRKITQRTCEIFGYSVGTVHGKPAHIAPYFDRHGDMVAQHVRFENKDFIWLGDSKQVQLFGQHIWRNSGRMVVVCEGELDAMSVSQVQNNKWPVVSIPSGAAGAKKALLRNLEWLEKFDNVVLCFDMDEPGQDAAKECVQLFTPGKGKIVHLPLKDANDMLVAGRTEELINAIWSAKEYRPDGIVNGQDLWEIVRKEPQAGFTCPYPKLNGLINGFRKGELVLFTAGSGIGKSTVVHELAYDLMMNQGQSLGILALEESVKRASERYMSIYMNRLLHLSREGVEEEQLKEAFDATVGSGRFWLYDHFGSTEVDNLLAKVRYLIVGCGVDFIVLDHISIAVSGLDEIEESERKAIDRLMTKLRCLVEETGVGILAVVHLRRPGQGKSYNEGRKVSLTDLRGSGSLEQLSDIVIAFERDQQGDNPNLLHTRVLKNRPVGFTGEADALIYDNSTGRLYVAEDENCPFGKEEAF
jgi:twinkle protein